MVTTDQTADQIPATHSPPGSQEAQDLEDQIMTDNPPLSNNASDNLGGGQTPSSAAATVQPSSTASINGKEPKNHGKPGSSWNTKKFREDYDRAFDSLLDKKWSMCMSILCKSLHKRFTEFFCSEIWRSFDERVGRRA